MRYRGFIITACFDSGIERYNRETGKDELCKGYYCQVYAGNDDMYDEQIDDFCLAAGHEIEDLSDAALTKGIREYVDGMHHELEEGMNFNKKSRLANILGRAVCFLGEFQSGEELYDTLTDQIGLTDDEIREIGFKSLAPFFNRDYYAQTIAEYLIDEGTDKTHSGNYHFSFAEVNERFGTSLPGDKEMLEKIVSSLDSEIVADVDATEDFDLTFYLDYCPYAEDTEEPLIHPHSRCRKELPMDKNKLKKLADYAVREGTEHTKDGRWSVSYDELYYHFGEEITDANENGKLLEEELRQREEINELIMTEDAIEMTYHLEHCPNCQRGGIAGALNLVSLMGCNIYDEHDEAPAEDLSDEDQPQVLSM